MRRPRIWWAVWSAEYPEHGALHVRARREAEARRVYRRECGLGPGDEEGSDLDCCPVTAAEHEAWSEPDKWEMRYAEWEARHA